MLKQPIFGPSDCMLAQTNLRITRITANQSCTGFHNDVANRLKRYSAAYFNSSKVFPVARNRRVIDKRWFEGIASLMIVFCFSILGLIIASSSSKAVASTRRITCSLRPL